MQPRTSTAILMHMISDTGQCMHPNTIAYMKDYMGVKYRSFLNFVLGEILLMPPKDMHLILGQIIT